MAIFFKIIMMARSSVTVLYITTERKQLATSLIAHMKALFSAVLMSYIASCYHFLFRSYGLNTKNFSVKKLKFFTQLATVITSERKELRSCNEAQSNR